ncbi:ABC transporter permease [Desulfatirhabdium butyrativorans]|uniref:ABC transporter permease n=1 Tax=Desulfatirhabdium butyrativorans TaxID=340467 RepID=UPI0004088AF6|nr:ABC transporter permease [Desulfatirhabdium butyrativorans]
MMHTIWTISRKESAQMLRSQRGLLWLVAFSGLLSAFSLLLVSNTELSLLDNAQVLYMMAGTVMAAGALLAVILGSDAYAGEKERGTLAPLLCAPIAANALLAGKAMGLLAAWGVMFVVSTPYLWAVGASGQNLGAALCCLALFGTPVVIGFGYLAMALSARTGSVLASLLSTVTLLMLAASPLIIGPGLRGTAIGRILDAVNPFAGALNTFDSVIIDSDPFSAQTARLTLVVVWLGLCLIAARRSAARPDFQ